MPFTPPRKVGFFALENQASMPIHTSTPTAGGQVGVDHRRGGVGPGVVRVTTVEAVPAEPQDAGTDRRHDQVVGHGVLSISQQPGSEDPGGDEARHTGRHVDDEPTGEVERALLGEVAAAPEQEGVDAVDEGRPQRHQEAPGAELDPAEHAPQEQQRRDRREHELEVGQRRGREVEGHGGVGRRDRLALFTDAVGDPARFPDEVLEEVLHPPHPGELGLDPVVDPASDRGGAEAHLVGPQHPGDEDQREPGEHHGQHVHRPLLLDDRRVEDRQSGKAHQADERGGDELPRVVAGIQPTGIRNG